MSSSLIRRTVGLGLVIMAAALGLLACGDGEDRPSSSGSASASVSGAGVEPGVVKSKPSNAVQVDVVLQEWAVRPGSASVRAGEVYFMVDNQGPEDPHEFVIIRTDLAPELLPVENNQVPESKVDIIGEIEPFAPKSKASDTFTLTRGNYVLICNITETEAGQVESHYDLGMRVAFRVE